MKKRNVILSVLLSSILLSCSSDDSTNIFGPLIELSEIEAITVEENSESGTELTQAIATTTEGVIVFSLSDQSYPDALEVEASTGIISINDATAFDFETRTNITAKLLATVGDFSKSVDVLVAITDVEETTTLPIEELRSFLQSCRWDIVTTDTAINKIIFEADGNLALNISFHGLAEWKLEETSDGVRLLVKYGSGDNWDVYRVDKINEDTIEIVFVDKIGEVVPIDFKYFNNNSTWERACA